VSADRNCIEKSSSHHALVIAEKPDAAKRIARALGVAVQKKIFGVDYYEVERAFDGSKYTVCSAAGHLYGLADPQSNRGIFPVFDVEWFPLSKINHGRGVRAKRRYRLPGSISGRIDAIKSLSEGADLFIHACDLDTEGEVIGYNILKFIHPKGDKNILRAKFSTLTDSDIKSAFSCLEPNVDLAPRAGRMRHLLDFLWGVNVSRALTESYLSTNTEYKMITMGRVQGPTLAFVVEREIELQTHTPTPFWTITVDVEKDRSTFTARYRDEPIRSLELANKIYSDVEKSKTATVADYQSSIHPRPPPYPFNLGDLQKESFRIYRISPSAVLSAAEKLYLKALISYPRTDSQKLPPSIGYSKILDKLRQHPALGPLTDELLKQVRTNPWPRQGPREDPAHPAIYPTGEIPRKPLEKVESLLHDLIIRRFLASFAENAKIEERNVRLDIASHPFIAVGRTIMEQGWKRYYPYFRLNSEESLLSHLSKGDLITITKAKLESKYTERPSRFTEGSMLSKLESENIGTKATRAETISTLISREYISKEQSTIRPTATGMTLIEAMEKFCPDIITPELTRDVERDIESISSGKMSEVDFLARTSGPLSLALSAIHSNALQLGSEFSESESEPEPRKRRVLSGLRSRTNVALGKCPVCNSGHLHAIVSPKTGKRFLGCTNFRNGCRASAPLPRKGTIKSTGNACTACGWPQLSITFARKNLSSPWKICPNMNCPSRTS